MIRIETGANSFPNHLNLRGDEAMIQRNCQGRKDYRPSEIVTGRSIVEATGFDQAFEGMVSRGGIEVAKHNRLKQHSGSRLSQ
ncbi:MAG: hypothetical protein M2R45_04519 [Verrucomicrobia subdivision 3 bacterium]|nr:hypothetical protein [Limisphaerales bacterium]MCS1415934.1 hypothetical protein [Limisphaerales bacterium]